MAAVLVHIDCDGDGTPAVRPNASSLKALAAGRTIATSWGATLYAAIVVHDPTELASPDSTGKVIIAGAAEPGLRRAATVKVQEALGRAGADRVVILVTDTVVTPLWGSVGTAWQQALDHLRPRLVLFGADAPSAAELGPRTGARIGARMLLRARAVGADLVELRDRDGGYVRAADSGAAVALIGAARKVEAGDANVDCIVHVVQGGTDDRIELAGTAPAELAHSDGVLVAIGDELVDDATAIAAAKRLATLLDAHLVGGPAAVRAGVVASGAVVDRNTAIAPELCIAVGSASLDLAGTSSLVRVGTGGGRGVDGALVGPVAPNLAALVGALEESS